MPAAWWLSRYVEAQLFGVQPMDLAAIAGALGVLLAVSVAAGLMPSRRAARIEPMTALRYESGPGLSRADVAQGFSPAVQRGQA